MELILILIVVGLTFYAAYLAMQNRMQAQIDTLRRELAEEQAHRKQLERFLVNWGYPNMNTLSPNAAGEPIMP